MTRKRRPCGVVRFADGPVAVSRRIPPGTGEAQPEIERIAAANGQIKRPADRIRLFQLPLERVV